MNLDVALEEVIPHPVEAVWGALTDGAAISEWLMPSGDFHPLVGTHFRLKTGRLSPTGWIEAELIELDPPRRMVWAWSPGEGAVPTTVTFELAPEGAGTRLTLTHTGEIDPDIGGRLTEGWPTRIELLRRSLD